MKTKTVPPQIWPDIVSATFQVQVVNEETPIPLPQKKPPCPSLKPLSFVKTAVTHADLRIDRQNRGYQLRIAATNKLLSEHIASVEDCVERIRQYFARTVLMQLQQRSPDFQIRSNMQRVAVQTGNGHTVVMDTLSNQTTAGLPMFKASASERVILTLTNIGLKPFYLTVVDLQSDGSLHVLLPETGHSLSDYQLVPGQTLRRRIRITEPVGTEVYKLLLTPEPIDLRAILQARGNYLARHPYETIFQRTYSTRGAPELIPAQLSDKAGATADVAFWVERSY